ncbi:MULTISPECIES: hypothetical protein [unclassified Nonomuraea]|uniref:hypothetical protein n=1 Tax=unclassified Nonomuraea TaxID=2593643 RepID=UPI0033FF5D0C
MAGVTGGDGGKRRHDMAALLTGGSVLPVRCAVQALEETVAEVAMQLLPVLGNQVDQNGVHLIVVKDMELDAGRLPGVADALQDAVTERGITEQEHADPGQLPTFGEGRTISAQILPNTRAEPFHFGGQRAGASHVVVHLLVPLDRLKETDEGGAANLDVGLVAPPRHYVHEIAHGDRAACQFESQDLTQLRFDVLEQVEGFYQ